MKKLSIAVIGTIAFIFTVNTLGEIVYLNHKIYNLEKVNVQLEVKNGILTKSKKQCFKQTDGNNNKTETVNLSVTQGIHPKHIRNIIKNVLEYLEVKNISDWERLLYLTLLVESDGGYYTKQIKGPAKGSMQLEPSTEKDVLRWLKVKHPNIYKKVKDLRIPARLGVHEAEYNIAYAVCMAYMEYFRRGVDPKGKSTEELAKLHKVHYNTYLGKASVDKTLKKLAMLGVKL